MIGNKKNIVEGLRRLKKIDFSARSKEYQIGYWDGITAALELITGGKEEQDDQNRTIQENVERKRSFRERVFGASRNRLQFVSNHDSEEREGDA